MAMRTYGNPPFSIAVIHGGPGAAGEMTPVARELSADRGVLEPLQTAATLRGQIDELRAGLEAHGDLPIVLVGFSWGAWLSYLLAAEYPLLVSKLVLVSSGPFDQRYADIDKVRLSWNRRQRERSDRWRIFHARRAGLGRRRTRRAAKRSAGDGPGALSRMSASDRAEIEALSAVLDDATAAQRDQAFARFGALMGKADAYDPLPDSGDPVEIRADIYAGVWPAAAELRRSGGLLQLGAHIECPVVAIHGSYDPHPAAGVEEPLAGALSDFRFVLLEECGHKPWVERRARGAFYRMLRDETR